MKNTMVQILVQVSTQHDNTCALFVYKFLACRGEFCSLSTFFGNDFEDFSAGNKSFVN